MTKNSQHFQMDQLQQEYQNLQKSLCVQQSHCSMAGQSPVNSIQGRLIAFVHCATLTEIY